MELTPAVLFLLSGILIVSTALLILKLRSRISGLKEDIRLIESRANMLDYELRNHQNKIAKVNRGFNDLYEEKVKLESKLKLMGRELTWTRSECIAAGRRAEIYADGKRRLEKLLKEMTVPKTVIYRQPILIDHVDDEEIYK